MFRLLRKTEDGGIEFETAGSGVKKIMPGNIARKKLNCVKVKRDNLNHKFCATCKKNCFSAEKLKRRQAIVDVLDNKKSIEEVNRDVVT